MFSPLADSCNLSFLHKPKAVSHKEPPFYLTIISKNPAKTNILFNIIFQNLVQNSKSDTKILLLPCKRETYAFS